MILLGERKNSQCPRELFKLFDIKIRSALPGEAISFGPSHQFAGAISVIPEPKSKVVAHDLIVLRSFPILR